jgi:hypothetical protein
MPSGVLRAALSCHERTARDHVSLVGDLVHDERTVLGSLDAAQALDLCCGSMYSQALGR